MGIYVNRFVTLLCLGSLLFAAPVMAATETVSLERLRAPDVVYLPTVRSQYQIQFTKPRTWQVSPSSQVVLEFQHSHALLPHRSWLQVLINDKVIKHIPLTAANAERTQMTIPLPVQLLTDFNTLAFRVEQHYTDRCEDPLDKSLWTQVLPGTKVVFNYTPTIPEVNLGMYPYPIVDPLTYSPVSIQYVVPDNASKNELLAMAMVNAHMAQAAGKKEMKTRIATSGQPPQGQHVAYIGTVSQIPEIQRYVNIVRRAGQQVSSDNGLILFLQEAGDTDKTVLVVTGATDSAVLNAARYLTTRPAPDMMVGQAAEVPTGWSPPDRGVLKPPRYLVNESRSFKELGFPIADVQKINAPPIVYNLPIMSDFQPNGSARLFLDLVYSYSPKLNPRFSSLELRMNDVSIANLPLTEEAGEELKRATVQIPRELIRADNELVAQFHLMPDKYGWCVDNYEDNAWGRIDDSSRFRIEGQPASRLPDIGLLNDTMYPYSLEDSLRTAHLVLPENPKPEVLDTMLAFTTRLGRATFSEGPMLLSLGLGNLNDKSRHQIVFRQPGDTSPSSLLQWGAADPLSGLLKIFNIQPQPNSPLTSRTIVYGDGVSIEQALSDNRAVTVVTAENPLGFQKLADLFEDDKAFEKLPHGYIQQLSLGSPQMNGIGNTPIHKEPELPWWQQAWQWIQNSLWAAIALGVLILLILVKITSNIIRKARIG